MYNTCICSVDTHKPIKHGKYIIHSEHYMNMYIVYSHILKFTWVTDQLIKKAKIESVLFI